ncbi:peptidase [Acidithiobacillus sp. HP-6]|uniref:peptidase n=1 Tax=unclassified Acidithiobacillus TaxID=2614800 RepID=UPI00187A3D77|nr:MULTISPECIES: peptidase [unclassified Acidithiobacillus]MBE7561557.1 peptidase [Acidithiobacillus sp. HP-6]MBE7570272.1 peptidase [Acidithiobacillus sp. HP-2]MDD2751090.1 peptidase [Acidithiobacillus sp.]MDD5280241.1 peptidase [Acidithiobacillus sp.]
MTYCLTAHVSGGLIFCSDSRTNAGTDNVSIYSKMHNYCWPGDRFLCLLSAGNLATTQGVVKRLQQDMDQNAEVHLLNLSGMAEAADYIGLINAEIQRNQVSRDTANTNFEATFILGGQIGSEVPVTYMIYPQGNYIHESADHPFLQIGEIKYGKPILDRVIKPELSLEAAARCALVSMNSTMRSNVTVGPPVELLIYETNTLQMGRYLSLTEEDRFYRTLGERWSQGLLQALDGLPPFDWETPTTMPPL